MTPLLDVRGLSKTTASFRAELVRLASRLSIDAGFLAAVMSRESGFLPNARNPSTNATGLIQFMPATARALGTTVEALSAMSAESQLAFVEKYYRPFAGRLKTAGDHYMATFMPAFVGSPPETVLFRKPEIGYTQNAGLDLDKDGTITVSDVTRAVNQTVADASTRPPIPVDENLPKAGAAPSPPPSSPGPQDSSSGKPSGSSPEVDEGMGNMPVLRLGQESAFVRLWQKLLRLEGYVIKIDGVFGDRETGPATKRFQLSRGLLSSGVVDASTWKAMI